MFYRQNYLGMTIKKFFLNAAFACASLLSFSQGASVWYFGESAGLDFATDPPTVIAGMTGVDASAGLMEMAATITDDDGNFLFGVNGNDIYSADLVKRGTTHSTDEAGETSQGAMIIPVPGTDDEYYVTTVPYGSGPCASGSPGYTRVRVTGTTGNNITIVGKTTLPTSNVAHGQMIIPKTDPITGEVLDEYWMYHHERNSNKFFKYSVENGSIVYVGEEVGGGPSFTQKCGDPGADVINFMKSNGCFNQFVIGNGDNVYLFDIDAETGAINYQNSAGPITQAYGVEFSASGKNVFISTGTTGGKSPRPIYKIPVSPGGLAGSTLGAPTSIGTMNLTRGGGMQMGPDGKIYIGGMQDWSGTPKESYLGVISDPDGATSFDENGVVIPNALVGMGVPAIPASLVSNVVDIRFQTGCKGEPIDFTYTFSGTEQTPEVRKWEFYDGPLATGAPASTSTAKNETYTWDDIGTYAVTLEVNDVCGRTRYDTAYVTIDELEVNIDDVDSVCPGENVTFSSPDPTAGDYKWFDAATGGTELNVGSSVEVTLVEDSVCVWVEPDGVVGGPFVAGHSTDQGYGAVTGPSGTHTFDALKPIKIDGFTVTGGSWSAGTENISISVKLGGTTVAGPVNVDMNTTGNTVLTDLNLAVPQGFGYEIEVVGGSFYPNGAWGSDVVSVDGIIAVNGSEFFQNWDIYEMNPCFARKRVCSYEKDCECRDTTLFRMPDICPDTIVNLDELLHDTTYQDGIWELVTPTPGVSITFDTILNVDDTYSGTFDVRYVVYHGADAGKAGCPDSNVISITVNAFDIVDIEDGQPAQFCVNDGNQTITLSPTTVLGGDWRSGNTAKATVDNAGEVTLVDSGTVWIYYNSPKTGCWKEDSIELTIEPVMEVEVTTPDVTFCKKDTTFTVELTPTSNTGGRWTAWDVTNAAFVPTAVDAAGNFDGAGLEPGDYIIKYAMDGFSAACSDSDSITVTINVLDTAEIINLPSVCNSDAAVNLQLNPAHVTTGTWYDSTGVNVGTYVDAAGLFDPQFGGGLPTGSVMVIFETDGSCAGRDTAYVTVTNNITYSMDHVQDEYCMNAANDFIAVSPGGGEFWTTSGVGIVDPATGEWDPKLYTAAGIDTIWYGKAGDCGDTVFLEVTLVAPDTADIDAVLPLCIDEPAFDLTASVNTTPGGTWSGAGITDGALGTFDALTAGPGDHKVKYTTAGTCPTVDSVQIIVRPRVVASIDSLQLAFCGVASEQVAVATPNNVAGFTIGRWEKSASWPADWDAGLSFDNDSTLRFDPTGRTVTTDTIFYIIDDNAAICGSADTLRIGISDMEIADIDTIEPVCADAGVVDFEFVAASGSVDGGVWRTDAPAGSMVDPAAGIFDPAIAGPGYYQIIYKTPGVCFVEDTTWLLVKPRVTVSLDQTSATQCAEGAAIEVSGSHDILIPLYDPTGTWFGSPTWPADWTAGLTVTGKDISIDPVNRVAGVDSIFYSIETNDTVCGDTIAFTLTIDALDIPDINGAGISAFCQTDAPVALNIMPTSTPGGTWYDSARVNVATYIDAAGLFDPGAAVAGINKVIYVTSGTCPKEDTLAIPVVGEIVVDVFDAPADIDFCANEPLFDLTAYLEPATTSDADQWVVYPVGGGATIPAGIVGTNGLDPTALTPGSYWVKYVIQPPGSTCGDSDSVVININAIPNPTFTTGIAGPICNDAGDQNMILDGSADGGGVWTLTGPAGSSIDAGTGVVTLGDSGTYEVTYTVDLAGCSEDSTASFYVESPADPTITPAGPFCEDDADVALVAASAGGAWSSPTGTIDAVTGVFSPAGSGDGTFTINYDFTGTCPVNGTIDITVNPVLDATIAPSDADVCVSAGTYAFTLAPTADPGGVWSSDPVGVIDPVTGELDLVAAVATNGNANTNVAVYYTHPGCGGASPARNILVETPGDPTFSPVGPICKNLGTVSLDNNPDQTEGGTWENLSAPGSIDPITGELDLALAADGVNEITYTVGGGCPAVWQEDITVNPVPGWSPEAANANGCEPHTTDMYLVLDDPAGSQPVTSTWTVDGVTSVVAGTNNINQTFPNDGDYGYYIRVEFDNGCIDSLGAANGLVRVNPVPTAMFDWGPKNATVIEPFIQFENLSVDGDEFDWELGRVSNSTGVGPTPNTSNEVNPSAIYSAPDSGWYDVTLIATNGECRDTFVDRVFILDNFTAFVPNAFTPNADGDNDFFLPLGNTFDNPEGLSEYEFLIFNRWGDLIWESNTPYEPWDGTHGRTYSKVQQDVYVWKLKVWDNVDAVLKTYYGRVSLIR